MEKQFALAYELIVLDRDEVRECEEKGLLETEDLTWIDRQEAQIVSAWPRMIAVFDERGALKQSI